jgi:hypothetical protein
MPGIKTSEFITNKELRELYSSKCQEMIDVQLMFPDFGRGTFTCLTEGYTCKWRFFAESKRKDKAPLILYYEEKENETAIEQKLEALFGIADITMQREKVISNIRPLIEKYWIISYDLKPKKDDSEK